MKKGKEFNKITAERLNTCIHKKFKSNAAFIRALNKEFDRPVNDTRGGRSYIQESRLSQILHGSPLSYEHARDFAKVLDVPAGYLLGELDYPSKQAEKDDFFHDDLKEWSEKDLNRIKIIKRVFHTLSESNITISFELKESGAIIFKNDSFSHQEKNCFMEIDEKIFYQCLINPEAVITLSHITEKRNTRKRYLHLNNRINVIRIDNSCMSLDINEFMKFIYDMDMSINNIIKCRTDYWFNYSGYNHQIESVHESVFYETW
jgi:hypothetical protein